MLAIKIKNIRNNGFIQHAKNRNKILELHIEHLKKGTNIQTFKIIFKFLKNMINS